MKKLFISAALIVLFPITSYSAETVSLDYVLNSALKESIGIAELNKNYNNKIAESKAQKLPENPEAQIMRNRRNDVSTTGYEYEIVQPLKLSDITGTRLFYASAIKNSANLEKQYELLKLINQTTTAYVNLWLLQETKKLYEDSANDSDKIGKLVEKSAEGGQTSSSTAALFNADSLKLRSDVLAIRSELGKYKTQLSLLTGINFDKAEVSKPKFANLGESVDKLVSFSETRANLRNLIKAKEDEARKRLYVARLDSSFNISPRVTYAEGVSGAEDVGIGFKVKIPFWNQNDAERLKANAELDTIKQQKQIYNKIPLKQVVSSLLESTKLLSERNQNYENKIIPSYKQSYDLSKKMFQNGQISAIELWQVREKLYQTQKESIQSFLDYINARSDLELEIGGKLEELQK